jgi:lactoylglutathione lyase
MLLRLSYVIVYCADMQRSVAFYRDQMGFPVKFESPEWTEFHTGSTTLALHIAKPSTRKKSRRSEKEAGGAYPALEVLDIEKFYQEKKAQGVEFSLRPTMQEFGQKRAVLLDPDGLPISVTEERR